jgi:hypothetical protein
MGNSERRDGDFALSGFPHPMEGGKRRFVSGEQLGDFIENPKNIHWRMRLNRFRVPDMPMMRETLHLREMGRVIPSDKQIVLGIGTMVAVRDDLDIVYDPLDVF